MASSRSLLFLVVLGVAACGWFVARAAEPVAAPVAAAANPSTQSPDDLLKQDFKANLPRVAPTEPGDVMKDFTVAPGFKLEQVAAEPLVNSPVAMEWDENGRLFVCEMRGYSENRDDGISRVSMLEDVDGDGRYDKSTVFVDKLLWPTALFCYDGGVFIGDAPDVRYYKDVDGDGRADVVQNVFTGFGTSNVQGLLNCFRWGFYAHRKINYQAVFLLPPEMMILYKPHIDFITEHAVDPDKRRYAIPEEAARHYIDIDHYGPYPYDSLHRNWEQAVARYSANTLQGYGIVPWWLQTMLQRLTLSC